MTDGTQKLTVEATAKGFGETAAEVKKVTSATEELQGKTAGGAEATANAAEAQARLNTSGADYVTLLRQINQTFGDRVGAILRLTKVSGDLASQDIDLAGALGKLTTSVANNWAAWKPLIVGGGSIVASCLAIAHALKKIREEQEAATKATRDHISAMTELRGEQRDAQAELERLADTRREGGYTADEARAAAQQVERVRGRRPDLDAGAVQQAVALGGAGRSIDETAGIAWILQDPNKLQLDPAQRPESREQAIERALTRHAEAVDRATTRVTEQQREQFKGGRDQVRDQTGGSLEKLIAIVERQTAGEGLDPERIARVLPFLRGASEAWNLESVSTGSNTDAVNRALQSAMKREGIERGEELSRTELARAEQILRTIEQQGSESARALTEAAEKIDAAAEKIAKHGGGVVQNFGRYIGGDADSQRRRRVNGQGQLLERVGQ